MRREAKRLMNRHGIGIVARLVLHVATVLLIVYVVLAAYGPLQTAVAHASVSAIGWRATVQAAQTLTTTFGGVVRALVPVVDPGWLVAGLIVLPSVLIESLLRVHSRRLQQIASVATSASPVLDPAWGDLFSGTPGTDRFGGAEAPAWLFMAPAEDQQPGGVLVTGLVLFPLWEILAAAAALVGVGLVLAGVFI